MDLFDGMAVFLDYGYATVRIASGLYQISGNDITAQLTRMIPGFSGYVESDEQGDRSLVVALTTTDGARTLNSITTQVDHPGSTDGRLGRLVRRPARFHCDRG